MRGHLRYYSVFPNFMVYGGFMHNLVWRIRPNGLDNASSLLEAMILRPFSKNGDRRPPVPMHLLGENEKWSDAKELGVLGPVLDQDMSNLPFVQQGLQAMAGTHVQFGRYTESRIRAHHTTLAKYVG